MAATLIAAPSSTKDKEGKQDPEMQQTQKGNQWYFGIKIHVGMHRDLGLIHSVAVSTTNGHDITTAVEMLDGEKEVF